MFFWGGKMKKFVLAVVITCAVIMCAAPAMAADAGSVEIAGLDMTVDIPNAGDYGIAACGGDYNDAMMEFLDQSGITNEEFDSYMLANNLALSCVSLDGTYEMAVSFLENESSEYLYDMDDLDEKDMREMYNAMTHLDTEDIYGSDTYRDLQAQGASMMSDLDFRDAAIVEINGRRYIRGDATAAADGVHTDIHMYATVANGRYVYFRLINYNGEAVEAQKALLEKMVRSAEYEILPPSGKTYAQDKAAANLKLVLIIVVIAACIAIPVIVNIGKKKKNAVRGGPPYNGSGGIQG